MVAYNDYVNLPICFFIDCIDLWDSHVIKKGPITIPFEKRREKDWKAIIYDTKDLSTLLDSIKVGQNYTMVLRVSSTCDKDVVVGFTGHGKGWFKSTITENSKNFNITTTTTWTEKSYGSYKGIDSIKFAILPSSACKYGTITIHKIFFMKGSENCLIEKG